MNTRTDMPAGLEGFAPEDIDSTVDPEAANRAAAALLEEPKAEHPEPTDPSDDTIVQLPAGMVGQDGTLFREAEVKEMTGEVEEAIMRPAVQKNPARMTIELLSRTVVRVGTETKITEEMLKGMLVGDLDALIMGVRRATYGDTLDLDVTCGRCEYEYGVEYSLSKDVPVRELKDSKRLFDVELRGGKIATIALPSGRDQEEVWESDAATRVERNHTMLGRCLRSLDGLPAQGTSAVRRMGLADIRTLVKFINETAPGPRYEEVEQECPSCGITSPLIVGLMELFRL